MGYMNMHSLPHPPFLLWGIFEDHLSDISCIILDIAILIQLIRKQYLFLEGMVSTPYNSIFSELKISHFFPLFCLLSLYRRGTAFHGVVLITLLVCTVTSDDTGELTWWTTKNPDLWTHNWVSNKHLSK